MAAEYCQKNIMAEVAVSEAEDLLEEEEVELRYNKQMDNLKKTVENAKTLSEIRNIFIKYSNVYTLTPEIWKLWLRKESSILFADYCIENEYKQVEKIKSMARKYFYHKDFLNYSIESLLEKQKFGRTVKWETSNPPLIFKANTSIKYLLPLLQYPNDEMEQILGYILQESVQPFPPEFIKEVKRLTQVYENIDRILSTLNSHPKIWLDALKESKNNKFIFENFEAFIGLNPFRIDIWNVYLNYLKETEEDERLLSVFSRYFRLFISEKTRNEYFEELKRQHLLLEKDVTKNWIDFIKFDMDILGKDGIESARKWLEKILEIKGKPQILLQYSLWFEKAYGTNASLTKRQLWIKENYSNIEAKMPSQPILIKKKPIIFSYEKMNMSYPENHVTLFSNRILQPSAYQEFSIPSNVIYYILQTSESYTLVKLYQTCKYFYYSKPKRVCHNLTVKQQQSNSPTYCSHSLFITSNHLNFIGLKNLIVTNTLNISLVGVPHFCSNLLKIVTLKIKYLVLRDQLLTENDFNVFVKLDLERVDFDTVEVKKEDNAFMAMDEILFKFSAANSIRLMNIFTTENTYSNVSTLQRSTKLIHLEMNNLSKPEDFIGLFNFLKENVKVNAEVNIHCSSMITDIDKQAFDYFIKNHLKGIKANFY